MGVSTKIQWADHTFNPWRGCTKVSPGCANCYAERQSHRNPAVLGEWGPNGKRAIAAESYWKQPLAWDRAARKAGVRRRVFCASLGDVFEDRDELISPRVSLFELIDATPNLDWLLLTKRPETWRKVMRDTIDSIRRTGMTRKPRLRWSLVDWLHSGEPSGRPFPPNVWLGVSVEDQKRADERVPILLEIPAKVRFLSVEPLLGPVDLAPFFASLRERKVPGQSIYAPQPLHWVIVGGESGPNARACDLAWIRSLVRQCKTAEAPVFVKQLGSRPVELVDSRNLPVMRFRDPKGGDPAEWPADLRVQEFPHA